MTTLDFRAAYATVGKLSSLIDKDAPAEDFLQTLEEEVEFWEMVCKTTTPCAREGCKYTFIRRRPWQRYHNDSCRVMAYKERKEANGN